MNTRVVLLCMSCEQTCSRWKQAINFRVLNDCFAVPFVRPPIWTPYYELHNRGLLGIGIGLVALHPAETWSRVNTLTKYLRLGVLHVDAYLGSFKVLAVILTGQFRPQGPCIQDNLDCMKAWVTAGILIVGLLWKGGTQRSVKTKREKLNDVETKRIR